MAEYLYLIWYPGTEPGYQIKVVISFSGETSEEWKNGSKTIEFPALLGADEPPCPTLARSRGLRTLIIKKVTSSIHYTDKKKVK